MGLSLFLFLMINFILGIYCLWKGHQISENKRYDLIQRGWKQPFSHPEVVARQVTIWNRTAGVSFFLIAVLVLVYCLAPPSLNPDFRSMMLLDQVCIIPLAFWKMMIIRDHDSRGGKVPDSELSGIERHFALAQNCLSSGKILHATLISNTFDEQQQVDGYISAKDNKFILQLNCQDQINGPNTTMHEFQSLAQLSTYLELNTKLRFGDFK